MNSLLFGTFPESVPTQYDEEAINTALQRLAVRQQQRQYTANKASNILSQSQEDAIAQDTRTRKQSWGNQVHNDFNIVNNNPRVQTNVEFYRKGGREDGHRHRRGHSASSRSQSHENLNNEGRRPQTSLHSRTRSSSGSRAAYSAHIDPEEHVRSANDTFNSFIEDAGSEAGNDNYPKPTKGNRHHHHVKDQLLKQQKMVEASRTLLEQSKAKHQAMVAQAHAAQKTKEERNGYGGSRETLHRASSQEITPKPPTNPSSNKKPTSSHRLARYVWT